MAFTELTVFVGHYYVIKNGKWFRFTDGAYDFTREFLTASGTTRLSEAIRRLEFASPGAEIVCVDLKAHATQIDPECIDKEIRAEALAKLTRKEREVLGV